MQPIHAIVSDLDDTLLTEEHRLTDRTLKTLRRIQAQGVKLILASGRSAASMRPIVQKTGTLCPYIAYNGAQVVDSVTGRVLKSNEIPLELAAEALRWFEEKGVYVQFYEGDDWYYERAHAFADEYAHSSGVVGTEAGKPLSAFIGKSTAKVLAIAPPEQAQALLAEARALFQDRLSVMISKPYFVEVTSPLATKGNAVATVAEMLGLSPETTICAGDSLNDLSMLSWSRLPVTVENARDDIKAMAWRVAGHGQRDGLALLLEELIPEESTC